MALRLEQPPCSSPTILSSVRVANSAIKLYPRHYQPLRPTGISLRIVPLQFPLNYNHALCSPPAVGSVASPATTTATNGRADDEDFEPPSSPPPDTNNPAISAEASSTDSRDSRKVVRVAWEKLVRWSRSWRSKAKTGVLERTHKVAFIYLFIGFCFPFDSIVDSLSFTRDFILCRLFLDPFTF